MPTPLTDATQTQTLATIPRRQEAPEMPPPPPPEAIVESRLVAIAKMRRPAAKQSADAFAVSFAPWAKSTQPAVTKAGPLPTQMAATSDEPPMFMLPVDETKLEALKTAIGILAGRIKATSKENPLAALFGAVMVGDDPFVRAARVRRTTGSSLSFGQRAIQSTTKTREGGAYLVVHLETEDARLIELHFAVQRRHPHSGRPGSFLEVVGAAPLANPADVELIDNLRQRLLTVWGRDGGRC